MSSTTQPDLPHYQSVDGARDILERKGFLFPANARRPEDEVYYRTLDLDSADPKALSDMMAYWTQMTNFAFAELARADGMVDAADTALKDRKAALLEDAPGSTVTSQKARVEVHPDVVALKKQALLVNNYANMLKALAEGYERNYRAVSRQIALHTGEFSREGRQDSIAGLRPRS